MRARNVVWTLILLLAIILFAIFRKRQEPPQREALNRTRTELFYYAFARCRMACLQVTEADVQVLLQSGIINLNRSNRRAQPCPLFAVQGRTASNKYIRVVFEQCQNRTYVVTCLNLKQETVCNCPTDYLPKQP